MKCKVKFGRAVFEKRTVKRPARSGGIVKVVDQFRFNYKGQRVSVQRVIFFWEHDKSTHCVYWTPCDRQNFFGNLSQALETALFFTLFDDYTEKGGR